MHKNLITPDYWRSHYPPYHSAAGWELEQEIARQQILYKIRDDAAKVICQRAVEMEEAAIAAIDEEMFWKYSFITIRVLIYRLMLLKRYPMAR